MPVKVVPTEDEFRRFASEMTKMAFRSYQREEMQKQFSRLGLKAPRPASGRELGFIFSANDLDVFVWTTWLTQSRTIKECDAGWVLIEQEGRAVYFAHPIHRTQNFFQHMLQQVWLARRRVLHRPLCPEPGCAAYMCIVRGRALKARYWRCDRRDRHTSGRATRLSWDHGLPPRAKKLVEELRSKRAKQRTKKPPVIPAILRRKAWQITRPENI